MEDWQREFPILTEYSNRKLFMRVGPLMIGLFFFKKLADTHRRMFSRMARKVKFIGNMIYT